MILVMYIIGFMIGILFYWLSSIIGSLWLQIVLFPIIFSVGYLIACGMFYKFSK